MADIKAIAEELVNLTVKEVNELATILKDEYGMNRCCNSCCCCCQVPQLVVLLLEERLLSTLFSKAQVQLSFRVVKAVKEHCGLGLEGSKGSR